MRYILRMQARVFRLLRPHIPRPLRSLEVTKNQNMHSGLVRKRVRYKYPMEFSSYVANDVEIVATKLKTEYEGVESDDVVCDMSLNNTSQLPITLIHESDLIDGESDGILTGSSNDSSEIASLEVGTSERTTNLKNMESDIDRPPLKKSTKAQTKTSNKNTKVLEEREKAKVRQTKLEAVAKELGLNKSLISFLEMCVFTDRLNRGMNVLNYYRFRSFKSKHYPKVSDVRAFDVLLSGFAAKGNTVVVDKLFKYIIDDGLKPSIHSFAAVLDCLGRQSFSTENSLSVQHTINQLETYGYSLNDIFNKTTFEGTQQEQVLVAIRRAFPAFQPKIAPPRFNYTCSLLTHLNPKDSDANVLSEVEGITSLSRLCENSRSQLELERRGFVTIKSIEQKSNLENLPHYRKMALETESKWSKAIEEALERNLKTLHAQIKRQNYRAINLYPFLKALPTSEYVRVIIQEIRKLAEGSENYSPSVLQLHRELGQQVFSRYQILYKEQKRILEKVERLYDGYLKWYENPSSYSPSLRNGREAWQDILHKHALDGPTVDFVERTWPNSILSCIGRFLYGIIMRDIKINANIMKMNSKTEQMVPAFYSIYRKVIHRKEEIKPHPVLVKLFQAASRDELTFETTLIPMLCPPMPWISIRTGGYLLSPAKIVRLPFQAHQQKLRLESCRPEDLYPSLDSLNQLAAVPWKVNQKVLDVIIEVFNNKGDDDLNIPPPPSECPAPPPLHPTMSRERKEQVHKERIALKRKKAEMYSLWCDALYRLSLANHFRNEMFWFPHNMDFRGRVYPCPPHLNHLGADAARAILLFAKGQPLGPRGLDWLKLHLVNLTGSKKRDSVEERLKYADEILDDILDSADNPLMGRKWWAKSEEPWQTLACCIEIADAIRSGDPESHISHFPVHQDGSCNGLQHYAALGRDKTGAESVNLAPSELPQDVYTAVANLVEKLRRREADDGVEIARILDGFIQRKVIKQTVMTTVYGVTRYGARLQIAKQLKDIPNFPKEHLWPASRYLVVKTFESLQEMFTSTKLIQDWFTDCARLISLVCGQNVEWITPLGLPVVQPYFRFSKKSSELFDPLRLPELHIFDLYERPNVMKQKNAFPPNFIHSLDSSHMMLTSLHCQRAGITFVSVHDCYWTHPASVPTMNKICREQFVALHSQPILEDLSRFLVEKYSYTNDELMKNLSQLDSSKLELNAVLRNVPKTGEFDLRQVLDSVYFFS